MKQSLTLTSRSIFIRFFCPAIILPIVFVVASVNMSTAAPPGGERVATDLRETWKATALEMLVGVSADDCTNVIEPRIVELEDFYLMSFRLDQEGGCITFANGDWIYLMSHSWHNDARVGDITLAIDSQKNIYYNDGHVCGGIINFYIGTETEITSAKDFFKLFMSDCDDCKWNLLSTN